MHGSIRESTEANLSCWPIRASQTVPLPVRPESWWTAQSTPKQQALSSQTTAMLQRLLRRDAGSARIYVSRNLHVYRGLWPDCSLHGRARNIHERISPPSSPEGRCLAYLEDPCGAICTGTHSKRALCAPAFQASCSWHGCPTSSHCASPPTRCLSLFSPFARISRCVARPPERTAQTTKVRPGNPRYQCSDRTRSTDHKRQNRITVKFRLLSIWEGRVKASGSDARAAATDRPRGDRPVVRVHP